MSMEMQRLTVFFCFKVFSVCAFELKNISKFMVILIYVINCVITLNLKFKFIKTSQIVKGISIKILEILLKYRATYFHCLFFLSVCCYISFFYFKVISFIFFVKHFDFTLFHKANLSTFSILLSAKRTERRQLLI